MDIVGTYTTPEVFPCQQHRTLLLAWAEIWRHDSGYYLLVSLIYKFAVGEGGDRQRGILVVGT